MQKVAKEYLATFRSSNLTPPSPLDLSNPADLHLLLKIREERRFSELRLKMASAVMYTKVGKSVSSVFKGLGGKLQEKGVYNTWMLQEQVRNLLKFQTPRHLNAKVLTALGNGNLANLLTPLPRKTHGREGVHKISEVTSMEGSPKNNLRNCLNIVISFLNSKLKLNLFSLFLLRTRFRLPPVLSASGCWPTRSARRSRRARKT
jgi:hypothetical protein